MEIIEVEQGSQQWLDMRRTKIGASDCPIICGVDPYRTAVQLWDEKMSGKKGFVSKAMKRGTDLEPIARELVQKIHTAIYEPIVVQSDEYDFMIASLDGYDENTHRMIEVKCPKDKTFDAIAGTQEVPLHWQYQMQHQMCVTGLQECTLVVFNGVYFIEIKVERDNALIEEIIAKEQAFYKSMQNYEQPDAPLPERTDEEALEVIEAFMQVDKAFEEIKELREIHREAVIHVSKGESFRCKGVMVKKIVKPGAIDYSKIEILKDVDLSKFRKDPTIYWRIT